MVRQCSSGSMDVVADGSPFRTGAAHLTPASTRTGSVSWATRIPMRCSPSISRLDYPPGGHGRVMSRHADFSVSRVAQACFQLRYERAWPVDHTRLSLRDFGALMDVDSQNRHFIFCRRSVSLTNTSWSTRGTFLASMRCIPRFHSRRGTRDGRCSTTRPATPGVPNASTSLMPSGKANESAYGRAFEVVGAGRT